MCQAGWRELESDPGLFTLLVEDFGVSGVQVEEVYDLSRPITEVVYGFIFLFRWDNSKKKASRRTGRSSAGSTTSLPNTSIALYTSASTLPTFDVQRTLASVEKDSPMLCRRSTSGYTSDGQPAPETEPTSFSHNTAPTNFAHVSCDSSTELFFARQMIQNSCATHALLSVLLNRPELDLGPMLKEFYRATRCLSPEAKGTAIGSMPHLAQAHNRHAAKPMSPSIESADSSTFMPEPSEAAAVAVSIALAAVQSTSSNSSSVLDSSIGLVSTTTACVNGTSQMDTFHFVSYVPFGGYLYELDSLKPLPINHGPLRDPNSQHDWTEQCACILRQRMQEQDVRYSLMAVVPDRRLRLTKRIATLNKNRQIIEDTLLQRALFDANRGFSPMPSLINGHGRSSATSPASDSGLLTHPVLRRQVLHQTEPPETVTTSQAAPFPSTHARRDCSFSTESSGSIQTRSITRAAAAAATVTSVAYDSNPYHLNKQATEQETSVSDSELMNRLFASNPAVSRPSSFLSHFQHFNLHRKCSRRSLSDDEDCIGAHKRRRLSSRFSPDTSLPHLCRDTRSIRMNKLLASIVSTESPLLLALSETVEAEAHAYELRLKSEPNGNHGSVCPSDSFTHRQDTDFSPKNESSHPNCDQHSPSFLASPGKRPTSSPQLLSRKPKPNGSVTDSVSSELPDGHTRCCSSLNMKQENCESFSNPFTVENGSLPADLTKPLIVNTELWGRSCSHLAQSTTFRQDVGSRRMSVQGCYPKVGTFRPQTRALTKARIRASSSSNSSMEQCNSHTSDSPLRSIKPSPHPYSSGTQRCPYNAYCKGSDEEAGFPSIDKSLFRESVTPSSSSLNESNYPMRSSTRRDTLASRNLAHMRITPSSPTPAVSSPSSFRNPKGVPSFGHSTAGVSDTRAPRFTVSELQLLLNRIKEQVKLCTDDLLDEEQKRQMYRIDDTRRVHNYEPFIRAYLSALGQHNMLQRLVLCALQSSGPTVSSSLSPIHTNTQSTNDRFSKSTPTSGLRMDECGQEPLCTTNGINTSPTTSESSFACLAKPSSPHPFGSHACNSTSETPELSSFAMPQTAAGTPCTITDNQPLTCLEPSSDTSPKIASRQHEALTIDHSLSDCVSNSSDKLCDVDSSKTDLALCDSTLLEYGSSEYVDMDPVCKSSTIQSSDSTHGDGLSNSPLISTTGASYSSSSCGSSSQSPQSSTSSSRSTVYLRPRQSQCAQQLPSTGNISRESLRPRASTERSVYQREKRSNTHTQSLSRSKVASPMKHNTVHSNRNCKVTNGSGPFSASFSNRVPKRRLC